MTHARLRAPGRTRRRTIMCLIATVGALTAGSSAFGATVTKNSLASGIAGFPSAGPGLGVYEPGGPGIPDAVREVGRYDVTITPDPAIPAEAAFGGTFSAYAVDDVTHHTDNGVPYPMILQLAADAWAGEYTPDVARKLTWLLRNSQALIALEADTARAAAAVQVVVWQTLRNPALGSPLGDPRTDLIEPTVDPAVNALAVKFTGLMEAGAAADLEPVAPQLALSLGAAAGCSSQIAISGTPGANVILTVNNGGVLTTQAVTIGPDGTAAVGVSTSPGVTVTVTGQIPTGGVLVRADIPGPATLDGHTTPSHQSEAPEELIFLAGAQAVAASVPFVCPGPPVPPVTPPVVPVIPPSGVVGQPTVTGVLRIVKSGPPTAIAGQVITYRIRVRNAGSVAITSVVLRDVLPAGMSVVAQPAGTTIRKGVVTWAVGTLEPGAHRTVGLRVRIDRGVLGRKCNNANASAANAPTVTARACSNVRAVAGAVRVPVVTG